LQVYLKQIGIARTIGCVALMVVLPGVHGPNVIFIQPVEMNILDGLYSRMYQVVLIVVPVHAVAPHQEQV
jgi:hypothetical protein